LIDLLLISTYSAQIFQAITTNQWANGEIRCDQNEECNINCDKPYSCTNTTIRCPSNHECHLTCTGDYSCTSCIVYAEQTTLFSLNDCSSGSDPCSLMTIFWPSTGVINGGNGLHSNLNFYAVHGWNDIDTAQYTGNYDNDFYGTMYCMSDYSASCSFDAKSQFSCKNGGECDIKLNSIDREEKNEKILFVQTQTESSEPIGYVVIGIIILSVCILFIVVIIIIIIRVSRKYASDDTPNGHDTKQATKQSKKTTDIQSAERKQTNSRIETESGSKDTSSDKVDIMDILKSSDDEEGEIEIEGAAPFIAIKCETEGEREGSDVAKPFKMSMSQKEYEEYIKKHNSPKPKKKKKKKKKKNSKKKKKNVIYVKSPNIIDESQSMDLWDNYESKKRAFFPHKDSDEDSEESSDCSVTDDEAGISKQKQSKKKQKKTSKKNIIIKQSETDKMLSPRYRKKMREEKAAKNLSRKGFKIKVKRRYRIDDGRIGICKYRGRTVFGKDGEDWIGLLVEYGEGIHNGTVKGRNYFLCAPGKGIMVRPQRIVEDLGMPDGKPLNKKIIRGSKKIRRLLQEIATEKEQEYQRKLQQKIKRKHKNKENKEHSLSDWQPPKFDDLEECHADAFQPKLLYSPKMFQNNIKGERKPKMHEI